MKKETSDVFDRSLERAPAVAGLSYWANETGISERELRRLIDEGLLEASQLRRHAKGSPLRVTKAAVADLLRKMSR